jgi:hypothetical protein
VPGGLLAHLGDMNIRRSIIGAVLAGASLVGVASMASSAAHAETPATTATTEREVGATAQSTRRFWIENLSSKTVYVDDAWGVKPADAAKVRRGEWSVDRTWLDRQELLPDDSVPGRDSEVRPGEHITIEVVSQLIPHDIAVSLRSRTGDRADVLLTVQLNTRKSIASSNGFQIDAGGQNITIRDK